MNIQITKKALTGALSHLTRIVPSRSSNTALTALVMRAGPGGLILAGTNLEVDMELTLDADMPMGAQGGPWLVPAHLFAAIVGKAPGQLVDLRVQDKTLHVSSGGNTTKIQLGDPETAATFTLADHAAGTPIAARDLLASVTSTTYACQTDAFQSVFKGMQLEFSEKGTRVVTSDGYRVAVRDVAAVPGLAGQKVIVPRRSIEEVARQLDTDREVRVQFAPGLLHVTRPDARLSVKLIDGDFPDYERIIPKNITLTATLSGAALIEALDRVSVLADKTANNRVELTFADGRIALLAEGDYGTAQDVVDATLTGSEPRMLIAVNAAHTMQAIKQMVSTGSGDVQVGLSNSTSPLVWRATGDAGQLAVHVALKV